MKSMASSCTVTVPKCTYPNSSPALTNSLDLKVLTPCLLCSGEHIKEQGLYSSGNKQKLWGQQIPDTEGDQEVTIWGK